MIAPVAPASTPRTERPLDQPRVCPRALFGALITAGIDSVVAATGRQEAIVWAFGGGFLALGAILYFLARATRHRSGPSSR